jgi:chaperonin GroES
MTETIKPLNDRLLVERIEAEKKSRGGIIMPDAVAVKEKPAMGKVIAVGNGKFNPEIWERIPVEFTVGQTVIFGQFAGTEVKIDDKIMVILMEDDIIAVVLE